MEKTFTISQIEANGDVTVVFSFDGEVQNLSGFPVDDPTELLEALSDYGIDYEDGLEVPPTPIPANVLSLLNIPHVINYNN